MGVSRCRCCLHRRSAHLTAWAALQVPYTQAERAFSMFSHWLGLSDRPELSLHPQDHGQARLQRS